MTYFKRILVPALVLAMILMFTGCGAKTEYDPHEYIDVGFQGLNGYATVFMDKHGRLNSKLSQEEQENIEYMLNVTTFEITPNENLKNGDVVKIKPVFDEKLCQDKKLKPVVREREVVVADLKEPVKIVKLYDDVKCSFGEKDGIGYIAIGYIGEDKFVRDLLNFECPREIKGLQNGDIINVTIVYDEQRALNKGYVFIGETTKEFTVTGLPEPKKD